MNVDSRSADAVSRMLRGEVWEVAKRKAVPKGEIAFYAVWRELPSESLMIEAGAQTLRDHLERRARQRRRDVIAPSPGPGL